jgi:hypothetical protein
MGTGGSTIGQNVNSVVINMRRDRKEGRKEGRKTLIDFNLCRACMWVHLNVHSS